MTNQGNNYYQALVQVKWSKNYPLAGKIKINPELSIEDALKKKGDKYGIIVEDSLLAKLNLKIGSDLILGKSTYNIRATFIEYSRYWF